jgi:uncharacterized membrane protein
VRCRQCGTEIADKALVCYRCGAATTDPIYKPVPIAPRRRRGSLVATVLALALLVLLALYMGRLPAAGASRMVTWVVVVVAVLIVALRAYARRR